MLKHLHLKLFTVCFLFVVSIGFSQTSNTDSLLLKLAASKDDTIKVNLLNKLWIKFRSSDPDKASVYFQQAFLLAKKLGYTKGIANSLFCEAVIDKNQGNYKTALNLYFKSLLLYEGISDSSGVALNLNGIGLVYMCRGEYDSALSCLWHSLQIRQVLGDKKDISGSYNNIGAVYYSQGTYDKAIEYYLKSLKIREELGDKKGMSGCYNNIGLVHYYQGSYDKAIEYYLRALKILEELGDKRGMSSCYNNIGSVHKEQDTYDKAIEYYLKSLKIDEELGDKSGMSLCYNNIGLVHSSQGTYDKAIEYYLKSLKITEELGDKKGIAMVYNNIASLNIKLEEYNTAIEYAQKGLKIAKDIGALLTENYSYQYLSDAYDSLGNTAKSYKYFKLYSKTKDSLFNSDKNEKITEMQTKYETEKKEKENKLLEKEKEVKELELAKKQNQLFGQRLLFTSVVVIIVFLSFVIYILYRNKAIRKRNKLQQELNLYMQKALSQQMNPHFIFNTVNSIQYYILNNDKVSSNKYLTMFARLMRMTLENSQHHLIPIQDEIQALNLYLELESLRFEGKFEYKITLDEENEISSYKIPTLLIQPYVENSIWHGLMHKEGIGKISVDIALTEDTTIKRNLIVKCTIEDNGIGREKAAEIKMKKNASHKSLGTKITENRLKLINSLYGSNMKVNFTDLKDENGNPKGTRVEIHFPVLE